MFADRIRGAVSLVAEGVNVSFILFGQGDLVDISLGRRGDGLFFLCCDTVFAHLEAKTNQYQARGHSASFEVTAGIIGIADEVVSDLLDAGAEDLEVVLSAEDGMVVSNVTVAHVQSVADLRAVLEHALAARNEAEASASGGHAGRAQYVFTVDVVMTVAPQRQAHLPEPAPVVTRSRLCCFEVPGTERLRLSTAELAVGEGALGNRAVMALNSLANTLADPVTNDLARHAASKLTLLMSDALGGNSVTVALARVAPEDQAGCLATLRIAESLAKVRQCPVVDTPEVHALLTRLRKQVKAREDARAVGGGGGGAAAQGPVDAFAASELRVRIRELEQLLVDQEEIKARIDQERVRAVEGLVGLREKIEVAVRAKLVMQADLIKSEEERLRIAKALIDLELENNRLAEGTDDARHGLEAKLLAAEAEAREAKAQLEDLRARGAGGDYHSGGPDAIRDLRNELEAQRAGEKARLERYQAEILKLANRNRTLEQTVLSPAAAVSMSPGLAANDPFKDKYAQEVRERLRWKTKAEALEQQNRVLEDELKRSRR